MKQQQRWYIPLASLFLASALTTSAALAVDPVTGTQIDEFDTKDDDNSALFNWLPGETYDPRTSTVGHYITDLHVTGTGLDITINRKFHMPIEPFTQASVYPQNFGTMMLDTPRLEYTTHQFNDSTLQCSGLVVSKQNQDPSGAITISGAGLTFRADNRAISFFPKSLGSYPASRFPSSAEYVSANNWYIDCDGTTFRVHRPNGVIYHLNEHEYHNTKYLKLVGNAVPDALLSATKKTVYVKKIVDPDNNDLTYTYTNQARVWIGQSFNQKVLSKIKANDGRRVILTPRALPSSFSDELKKQCPPLIATIEYNKDPSKNVDYEYDSRTGPNSTACELYLNRVVRSDGGTFHYDYNLHMNDTSYPLAGGLLWADDTSSADDDDDETTEPTRHAIKSITYPEGAKVSYDYTALEQCAFTEKLTVNSPDAKNTCANIAALSERTITGDLLPAGMQWRFSTQQIPEQATTPKMFRSVIDGPAVNNRRTRQVFQYVVKYANTEPKLVGAPNGKLIQHQVIDVPADLSNTGTLMKQTDYTWEFHGDVVDFTQLNSWNKNQKFAWQHLNNSRGRTLKTKTITVDGNTFNTTYDNFNHYGHATRHAQYHGAAGRTIALEYLYNTNPWIVGKVSKKTVEKVDGSTDFMVLERTFNPLGKVSGERLNGLYNAYTYHADGELHTVKNGDTIQISTLTNYQLGLPKTIVRANSTGAVQKDITLYPSGKLKTESAWGKPTVKSTFTYYTDSGKLNTLTPPTTQASKFYHPKWNPADAANGHYRREFTGRGPNNRHRNVSFFDTLGRPLIQYEHDTAQGDIVFTYFRYDANGRLAYQSLPVSDNYVSQRNTIYSTVMSAGYTFEYDALGRVTQKTHTKDSAQKTRYCYSPSSCQSAGMHHSTLNYGKISKDAEGYVTVVNYRAFGNPSHQHVMAMHQQITGQNVVSTLLNRDLVNRVTSVSQDGTTRSYTYKPGTLLLASESHPETGITEYTSYDNQGNLLEKETADGSVTTFAYYPNNLISAIDYPSGTDDMAFTYNADDSLASLVSGAVTRQFTYRDDGLLASETVLVDNQTMTLSYDYDGYGFVNKTTYPSSQSVLQTNNTLGWVKAITNVASDIHYHANGVMKQAVLHNGQTFSSTQDANDRVARWKVLDQEGDSDVHDLWYNYDDRDNISSLSYMLTVNSDPRTISMAYDGLNRLTQADSTGLWGTGHIQYNNSGDITQLKLGSEQLDYHYAHTFSNNRTKLLRTVSSTSGLNNYLFDYDMNGNVIDNGKRSFLYDKANRMTHADVGGRVYDFIYDGDGRRVRSIRQDTNANNTPIASTKVTQYFFYNSAGKLMYEKNTHSGIRKDHIFANGKAIAERHYYNPTVDTDNDGLPNHYEELYGLQTDNGDANSDSDNDGVSNYQEYTHGSNPNSQDTDNDGLNDWMEADYGLNIVENDRDDDLDGDGVSNYNEVIAGTNPADHLMENRMQSVVPILEILLAPDAP